MIFFFFSENEHHLMFRAIDLHVAKLCFLVCIDVEHSLLLATTLWTHPLSDCSVLSALDLLSNCTFLCLHSVIKSIWMVMVPHFLSPLSTRPMPNCLLDVFTQCLICDSTSTLPKNPIALPPFPPKKTLPKTKSASSPGISILFKPETKVYS